MKNSRTICFVAVVLCLGACRAIGVVEFKDGLTHDIDYIIADTVRVDEEAMLMYTTVNLLDGGRIRDNLEAFEDSVINILGGSIDNRFFSSDYSQVNISGGSIGMHIASGDFSQVNISGGSINHCFESYSYSNVGISGGEIGDRLFSYGFSRVTISGGAIGDALIAMDFSQVDISGGAIGGLLDLHDRSVIQIFGSDFAVDGQSVDYGELTSILGGYCGDEPWRRLTGTLASGEPINNDFRIGHYGSIVLIPEPATIVLLGLGALALSKRRK